jgi:hypothetical protein
VPSAPMAPAMPMGTAMPPAMPGTAMPGTAMPGMAMGAMPMASTLLPGHLPGHLPLQPAPALPTNDSQGLALKIQIHLLVFFVFFCQCFFRF